jgi:LCP family protein required for cell wall assembly
MSERQDDVSRSSPEGPEPRDRTSPEPADPPATAVPADAVPAEDAPAEDAPADAVPEDDAGEAATGEAADGAEGADAEDAPEPIVVGGPPPPRRRHGRLGKVLMVSGVVALFAAGISTFGVYHEYDRVVGHVKHVTVFGKTRNAPSRAERPDVNPLAEGAINILMTGSDARNAVEGSDSRVQDYSDSARTDTMMILHITKDHDQAYLLSLPRDAWVPIDGHGHHKLNASFAYGGPPLLRQTVEEITGVRIDHYVQIDFAGIKQLTDLVGGVDVNVDTASCDERDCWTIGPHHLSGDEALRYVRQRKDLANDTPQVTDWDREHRQQQYLFSVMTKLRSEGVTNDWTKLQQVAEAVSKMVTVDENFSILDMAWNLRHLSPTDVTLLRTPIANDYYWTDTGELAMQLGDAPDSLWKALQTDTMDEWVAANPTYVNSPTHGN